MLVTIFIFKYENKTKTKVDTGSVYVLQLTVTSKEATFAVILMIAYAQLRKRVIEGFCDLYSPQSPPPQSSSLDKKPLKRTLQKYVKGTEVSSPQ